MLQNRKTDIAIMILAAIYFALVIGVYIWERLELFWDLFVTLLLMLFATVVIAALIYLLSSFFYSLIKNNEFIKSKLVTIVFTTLILLTSYYFVLFDISNPEFDKPPNNTFQYIGSGNCSTTIKLFKKNEFIMCAVCFGVSYKYGKYNISKDTVYLIYNKNVENKKQFIVLETSLDSVKSSNQIVWLY